MEVQGENKDSLSHFTTAEQCPLKKNAIMFLNDLADLK